LTFIIDAELAEAQRKTLSFQTTLFSSASFGVCRKTLEKRFTQRRGGAKNAKKKKKEFVILYNIRNYYILLPLRLGVLARDI